MLCRALSGISIRGNTIVVSFSLSEADCVVTGLRALYFGAADKVCFAHRDNSHKLTLSRDGCASIVCAGEKHTFSVSENDIEAIEKMLIEFILGIAFSGRHTDIEILCPDGKKDCVFKVDTAESGDVL